VEAEHLVPIDDNRPIEKPRTAESTRLEPSQNL